MLWPFNKASTSWLAVAFTSATGGIASTAYFATQLGTMCRDTLANVTDILSRNVVTPAFTTEVTIEIDGTTAPVSIQIPSYVVKVSEVAKLLGEGAIETIEELPALFEKACAGEMSAHAAAYIAIVVGLSSLTAYAIHQNFQLKKELANKENKQEISTEESSLLPKNSIQV